jgi:hypothetical protein
MSDKVLMLRRMQTPDGTVLTSRNRHDFTTHQDENGEDYMLDGGAEYLRTSKNIAPMVDVSVYSTSEHSFKRQHLAWGTRGIDGESPLEYKLLKDLTDGHMLAILETQIHIHKELKIAIQDELNYRKSI